MTRPGLTACALSSICCVCQARLRLDSVTVCLVGCGSALYCKHRCLRSLRDYQSFLCQLGRKETRNGVFDAAARLDECFQICQLVCPLPQTVRNIALFSECECTHASSAAHGRSLAIIQYGPGTPISFIAASWCAYLTSGATFAAASAARRASASASSRPWSAHVT